MTVGGAFVGLLYGFVAGFLGGWTLAFLRNAVVVLYMVLTRRRAERLLTRKLTGVSVRGMGTRFVGTEDGRMDAPEGKLEEVVLTRLLRLNATIQGVAVGLLLGLAIFIATNWLVLKGGAVVGPHLSLLGQFFIGYRVTFLGSFVGFAYGFVCGFLTGYFLATVYNFVAARRERLNEPGP